MKLAALLPMKAHSSRVPHKNFREIAGKPLYRWMLDKLLEADFIDEVVINTDAQELLGNNDLAHPRLRLRSRPEAIRGDEVSMNRVIENDLAHTEADHFLMTHTTNPALTLNTLQQAFERYRRGLDSGQDSLFGVNRHQTRFYTQDGTPVNHDPSNLIPTQDLEPWFEENSCFYFFSKCSFQSTGARIGTAPLMHETPKLESCDIDEWDDWHLAELILKSQQA